MTASSTVPASRRPRLAICASLALSGVLLAACWQLPNQLQGPVALKSGEDGLEIAVCTSVDASTLVLEARLDGESSNAWVGQGNAFIESGTVITAENLGDLFPEASADLREFEEYSDLSVLISSKAGGDNVVAAFEPSLLTDDSWLHPDDSHSAEACT